MGRRTMETTKNVLPHYTREELITRAEERYEQVRRLQEKGLICLEGDFVPSVHYPPITEYPHASEDFLLNSYTVPKDGLMDIYVHFPFCQQHCLFCHYPGKVGLQTEEKNRYLKYLKKEMDLYMNRLGIHKWKPRSILIGGGTPTYLTPEQLEEFLAFFTERVDFSECKQFNYDLDPNTLLGDDGQKRMELMKKYGVTRLTIGIQSLNDEVLKLMNRGHDAKMAVESVIAAKEAGFDLNIEFIYGHPGETLDNWMEVMEQAVTLPTDEIQIYRLKVKAYGDMQGAIIHKRESGHSEIPDFKTTMMMKQMAVDIFNEHGFHENLRRVYSRQNKIFSHYAYNQCCNLYDQIGFGLTAFSSFRDRFALNTQYFEEYYDRIDHGLLPVNRGYIRDKEQQLRWGIVLPLKNTCIRKSQFLSMTGKNFDDLFKKKTARLKEEGLLTENEAIIKLTELGGFVADEVVEQYNATEFLPFPESHYADGPLNPYRDNTTEDAMGDE